MSESHWWYQFHKDVETGGSIQPGWLNCSFFGIDDRGFQKGAKTYLIYGTNLASSRVNIFSVVAHLWSVEKILAGSSEYGYSEYGSSLLSTKPNYAIDEYIGSHLRGERIKRKRGHSIMLFSARIII
jgi:hypothetical protein